MANVGTERSVNLSSFLGLDNRRPDFRLKTQDGALLRAAANVDISDGLTCKRRAGSAKVVSGTRCHSFWTSQRFNVGYYVDGTSLIEVRASGGSVATYTVASGLSGYPMSFTDGLDSEIVFSDGVVLRNIVDKGMHPFGIAQPARAAQLDADAGGFLPIGMYSGCYAYKNTWGDFSATSPTSQTEITENNGSIIVSGLSDPFPPGADEMVLYMSPCNADGMYEYTRFSSPPGDFRVMSTGAVVQGKSAFTYGYMALPAGQIVRFFSGRLYSAADDTLWFSRPYNPTLCDPTRDYIQFNAPITVLEPCDAGLFIVADKTYFMSGDPSSATLATVSPNLGVLHSGGQFDATDKFRCFWMSDHGLTVGNSDGTIELYQDEHVFMPLGATGASLFREADGARQVLSAVFNAGQTTTAASSYMSAEIVRKGTTV